VNYKGQTDSRRSISIWFSFEPASNRKLR